MNKIKTSKINSLQGKMLEKKNTLCDNKSIKNFFTRQVPVRAGSKEGQENYQRTGNRNSGLMKKV